METGKMGGKIPAGRGQNGRKDAATDSGMKIGMTAASPTTASAEPAGATAGTRVGTSNGGGDHPAGGTQIRAGRAVGQAPEHRAGETTKMNRVVTSGGGAAQEQQLAEG